MSPVIDLVNKKISWSFDSFPAGLIGQTVRFKLRTNTTYTGSSTVSFDTSSRIVGPGVTTDDSTVATTYRYTSSAPTSTPSPTPVTSSSSTPTPTITPTQSSTPRFESVNLIEVAHDKVTLEVLTNLPTKTTLYYGESTNTLTRLLSTPGYEKIHNYLLTDLTPGKIYFFRIKATVENGAFINSDYYIVRTPSENSLKEVRPDQVQLRWEQVPLTGVTAMTAFTILQSPLTISISVPPTAKVKSMQAHFVLKNVLGIATEHLLPTTSTTNLIEVLPNTFVGELLTPTTGGDYLIVVRVTDMEGGIRQLALPYRIHNTSPIAVSDNKTKKPIEHASVVIKRREEQTGLLRPLDQALALPRFTDERGIYKIILPQGSYQILVSAPGYKSHKGSFELTPQTPSYPSISLTPEPSLLMSIIYVREAITDLSRLLELVNASIITSYRGRTVLFGINIAFLLLFSWVILFFLKHKQTRKTEHFWHWFFSITAIALTDILLLFSILIGVHFLFQSDSIRGMLIIALSCINITLWIQFVREIWKVEHDLST
ncbi:MAG: hypothetical protein UZ21_OP11001000944 [Microgenomates bacterium OLB22]|nr:MAG: hypothetical protein UZ21_OP11001000944 [Microgenomates bacterium OLB22]